MSEPLFGYLESPSAINAAMREQMPQSFSIAGHGLRNSGEGRAVMLNRAVEAVAGMFPIHRQTIGDCVSHGWGLAIDVLRCMQILKSGGSFNGKFVVTESIYGMSRIEHRPTNYPSPPNGDGSFGIWAQRAVEQGGVLVRDRYSVSSGITYDLTSYDGDRARTWGWQGVPDLLEPIAREHPVTSSALVTEYSEARDAIANGFPVAVCSNQGFEMRRDSRGFARPQGNWAHCMCFIGVDDRSDRKGLLCMNSWGSDWISGPKRLGQPDGSFWVDADVVTRMLRNENSINPPDSYAISGFVGFPASEVQLALSTDASRPTSDKKKKKASRRK